MGRIQVGAKSPKTVDMGGFTVAPDVVTEGKVNVDNAEGTAKLQDGHGEFAGKDANVHDEAANETPDNGEESAKNETSTEESTKKKNKKA